MVAIAMLGTLLALAIIGPPIFSDAAEQTDQTQANLTASAEHIFGTDALGRDVLARVLTAARLSLVLSVCAVIVGFAVGVPFGAFTALLPARAADAVARVIDIVVAFPPLLLSIVLSVILGIGAFSAVLAIGIAYIPYFARLSRNLASQVVNADYIAASRLLGVGRGRLLIRHVFPNVGETLLLNGASAIGSALLAFAALSFLGLGVQSPDYDWGRLLSTGLDSIYVSPAAALGPAIGLVFAGITFNFVGEGLAKQLARRPQIETVRRPKNLGIVKDNPADSNPELALSVRNLRVGFGGTAARREVVCGVDLDVKAGEIVGIVGESGSGKSLTALSLTGLQPLAAHASMDDLRINGESLRSLSPRSQRRLLGRDVAYVFQDPMSYLNPSLTISTQLTEASQEHRDISAENARWEAVEQLRSISIDSPERRISQYPHEFSGGMRQRAMIAMALMNKPKVLIADEPTTALDVTVQSQVLEKFRAVRDESDIAIIMISHDIGVIAELCDRVVVMYAGKIVEELGVEQLPHAQHPYTRALLDSTPTLTMDRDQALGSIEGRPPVDPGAIVGCAFADRCAYATAICQESPPELLANETGGRAACFHPMSTITTHREEAR